MKSFENKILVGCLALLVLSALVMAGNVMDDAEYQQKLWANILMLETELSDQQVKTLLALPSEPVTIDPETGQVSIAREFFVRKTYENGRPRLGLLYQVTDTSAWNVVPVYNANGKKK